MRERLEPLTMSQLRALAKRIGVAGYSSLNKSALIDLLLETPTTALDEALHSLTTTRREELPHTRYFTTAAVTGAVTLALFVYFFTMENPGPHQWWGMAIMLPIAIGLSVAGMSGGVVAQYSDKGAFSSLPLIAVAGGGTAGWAISFAAMMFLIPKVIEAEPDHPEKARPVPDIPESEAFLAPPMLYDKVPELPVGCQDIDEPDHRYGEVIIKNKSPKRFWLCIYSRQGKKDRWSWHFDDISADGEQFSENWKRGCKYLVIYDPTLAQRKGEGELELERRRSAVVGWRTFSDGTTCSITIEHDVLHPDTDLNEAFLVKVR